MKIDFNRKYLRKEQSLFYHMFFQSLEGSSKENQDKYWKTLLPNSESHETGLLDNT